MRKFKPLRILQTIMYKKKILPQTGDTRIRTIFPLFPKTILIGNIQHTIWLTSATVTEVYTRNRRRNKFGIITGYIWKIVHITI